jgi:hypothetical protein
MTTSRSDELIVGVIALGLIPWIGWTVARGLKNKRLPIGRGYVERAERTAPFVVLLTFYSAAAVMAAYIGLDLLFGVKLEDML